jgi:S1-C subfamily serine protease
MTWGRFASTLSVPCPNMRWTAVWPLRHWCFGARRVAAPWSTASGFNGVVLIASTNTVGTGVVVSEQGDIITNEHVIRDAYKARGDEWVAVWFKPSNGVRPTKSDFLLAKILQRNQRRDLAHIQLAQLMPPTAVAIPLATVMPRIGQEVFTIGHPKTYLWSFNQGIVSQIRPDYEWKYSDGILRSATAIQTQAPLNPGDSGGPLLDDEGTVVGIVVGSAPETEGVYFAVSVHHVRELLPH